jgi:hypothetical protein
LPSILPLVLLLCQGVHAFVHPGILSTKADLDRVRSLQSQQPWASALAALKATPAAKLTYAMQGPYDSITRGTTILGWTQNGNDANACYIQALLWYVTDQQAYADNAIRIINSWSNRLKFVGGTDVALLTGIQGPLWAMAGEILANSGKSSGWHDSDIVRAKSMLTNLYLPPMVGFDPADGANFSTSCLFSTMAIAVFTDNQPAFDSAWSAFISTAGCPNDFSLLRNIAANGQNVESGRDQVHSWSSYEMLAGAAEIARNQGKTSYPLGSNRLLTGVEYWSRYNLGDTVPFDRTIYRCRAGFGPWSVISSVNRGIPNGQGAVFNMVLRAYQQFGLAAPNTLRMATAMGDTIVPANPRNGWGNPFIADALLYHNDPTSVSAATGTGLPSLRANMLWLPQAAVVEVRILGLDGTRIGQSRTELSAGWHVLPQDRSARPGIRVYQVSVHPGSGGTRSVLEEASTSLDP